jgi:hypothetical protein
MKKYRKLPNMRLKYSVCKFKITHILFANMLALTTTFVSPAFAMNFFKSAKVQNSVEIIPKKCNEPECLSPSKAALSVCREFLNEGSFTDTPASCKKGEWSDELYDALKPRIARLLDAEVEKTFLEVAKPVKQAKSFTSRKVKPEQKVSKAALNSKKVNVRKVLISKKIQRTAQISVKSNKRRMAQ